MAARKGNQVRVRCFGWILVLLDPHNVPGQKAPPKRTQTGVTDGEREKVGVWCGRG